MRRRANPLVDRGGRVIRACNRWHREHGLPVSNSSTEVNTSSLGTGSATPDRDVSPATEGLLLVSPEAKSGEALTSTDPVCLMRIPMAGGPHHNRDGDEASGVVHGPDNQLLVPVAAVAVRPSSTDDSFSHGRRRRKYHRRGGRKKMPTLAGSPPPSVVPARPGCHSPGSVSLGPTHPPDVPEISTLSSSVSGASLRFKEPRHPARGGARPAGGSEEREENLGEWYCCLFFFGRRAGVHSLGGHC